MAGPSKELLEAVNEIAAENDWSAQDILTIYSYETGGTMNPWQKGPTTKWGEHRGLIQWGEPQRKKYGVTADMPVREQVQATARYWKDRGAQPGMGILPLYAAVNAGNVNNINASDEAAGGAPGTVLDKVNNQMHGHAKKAAGWLGQDYVPYAGEYATDSAVPPLEGESQQVPIPEELTLGEQLLEDGKGILMDRAKEAIFGSGDAPAPPPIAVQAPPPPPRRPRNTGPVVLRERKTRRKT